MFLYLYNLLKNKHILIMASMFFALAWPIDSVLSPYLAGEVVDLITNYHGEKPALLGYLLPTFIKIITLWLYVELSFRACDFSTGKLLPEIESIIRTSSFSYALGHSHNFFSNNFAGNMARKISDLAESFSSLLSKIIWLIFPISMGLICSVVLFTLNIHYVFGIFLTSWFLVHITICIMMAIKVSEYSEDHSEARSELSGRILDSLTNYLNIKLFASSRLEKQYISKYQDAEMKKNKATQFLTAKFKIALGIVTTIFLVLNVLLMFKMYQHEQISLGQIVQIYNITWNLVFQLWWLGLELPLIFKDYGVCKQAYSLLANKHDILDKENAKDLMVTKGEISFDNVGFTYVKNNNLFQNKTVAIEGCRKTGLVGFSGSGKTTFANLIIRLYDVNSGQILIDGQDIAQVSQDSLRSNISYIPQDPVLFHRTLLENIAYGKENASKEEVIEAAKKAHIHEFIMNLPEQYDTEVGERGVKLSGGQRQRIAIARAILKDAPILILDEATSALDSVTERLIQESIALYMQNKTIIVIAHRLSTLLSMDRILVFDKGSIIEDGRHTELITRENGLYAKLWQSQVGGFLQDQDV